MTLSLKKCKWAIFWLFSRNAHGMLCFHKEPKLNDYRKSTASEKESGLSRRPLVTDKFQ